MQEPSLEAVKNLFAACSWGNTTETAEDWLRQLRDGDDEARARLFKRAFVEGADSHDLKALFSEEHIKRALAGMTRPLPRSSQERRRKVWRYLYLGVREAIPELDWRIGS